MDIQQKKILGISGSLRPGSSASKILRAAGLMVPRSVRFTIYDELETIPPFNDSDDRPPAVVRFLDFIAGADAVLFCIPEYAFGVPGALKNAMDWTVSTTVFSDKPVALITAASSGEKAHAAFQLTLQAIGTRRSKDCSLLIPYVRTKLDEAGSVSDPLVRLDIERLVNGLIRLIDESEPGSLGA